jgi:hypothetical protein
MPRTSADDSVMVPGLKKINGVVCDAVNETVFLGDAA